MLFFFFFFLFFFFSFFFFFKQKTAYEMIWWLEFRRVLFRSTRLFASKDGRKTLSMHKYGDKNTPLELSVEWPLQTFTHTLMFNSCVPCDKGGALLYCSVRYLWWLKNHWRVHLIWTSKLAFVPWWLLPKPPQNCGFDLHGWGPSQYRMMRVKCTIW